jgi:CheY-like chemotaxis protein
MYLSGGFRKPACMIQGRPISNPPLKYLVVDDHREFREIVRTFLPGPDPLVFECDNGASAVGLYAEKQPDWVLMDIRLPEMNGIEATRRIVARFPAARVVILTQFDDADLRAAAKEVGACACLVKDQLFQIGEIIKAEDIGSHAEPGSRRT